METMRAAGYGDGNVATCSMPSSATSATKRPWPATKRRSSRTRRSVETKRKLAGSTFIWRLDRLVGFGCLQHAFYRSVVLAMRGMRRMMRARCVGLAQTVGCVLHGLDNLAVTGAAA